MMQLNMRVDEYSFLFLCWNGMFCCSELKNYSIYLALWGGFIALNRNYVAKPIAEDDFCKTPLNQEDINAKSFANLNG